MSANTRNSKFIDVNYIAILAIRLVCLGWLTAKIIGWKLWIRDRQFPLVPVLDWLNWPSLIHYILFVLSLGLIIVVAVKPFNKVVLWTLFSIEILSCLADQNRWQPWQYQYLFTIAVCIINYKQPGRLLTGIAFIMFSTYLYSGIGKFNEGYLVLVWDNIFLKKIFKISEAAYQQNTLHYLGYVTALLETLFAIGLLFSKTKKAAAIGMILMHTLVLYAIGPAGINYNIVVWPWNILMIMLLYLLFIRQATVNIHLTHLWAGYNKVILIAWGILPALNYIGLWDNYLSSRLYSGGLPLMAICLKPTDVENDMLQPYLNKTDTYQLCNGSAMINLQNWAMKEMNVPPYPEMRVYRQIEKNWRIMHPLSEASFVFYYFNKQHEVQKIENK